MVSRELEADSDSDSGTKSFEGNRKTADSNGYCLFQSCELDYNTTFIVRFERVFLVFAIPLIQHEDNLSAK